MYKKETAKNTINKEQQGQDASQNELNIEDNSPVIDALLTEYQMTHNRVFKQIAQYDETNVKIMMLIGVLLFFGITKFDSENYYISLFVDIAFILVLPIIGICSILLSLADLIKVMILGDYLKIIENKINNVLKAQTTVHAFPRNRIMDWEYWRIYHGHVKGIDSLSEISFSMIIVALSVIVSYVTASIRLSYIICLSSGPVYLKLFKIFFIILLFLLPVVLIISLIIYLKRRKKTKKNSANDMLTYE